MDRTYEKQLTEKLNSIHLENESVKKISNKLESILSTPDNLKQKSRRQSVNVSTMKFSQPDQPVKPYELDYKKLREKKNSGLHDSLDTRQQDKWFEENVRSKEYQKIKDIRGSFFNPVAPNKQEYPARVVNLLRELHQGLINKDQSPPQIKKEKRKVEGEFEKALLLAQKEHQRINKNIKNSQASLALSNEESTAIFSKNLNQASSKALIMSSKKKKDSNFYLEKLTTQVGSPNQFQSKILNKNQTLKDLQGLQSQRNGFNERDTIFIQEINQLTPALKDIKLMRDVSQGLLAIAPLIPINQQDNQNQKVQQKFVTPNRNPNILKTKLKKDSDAIQEIQDAFILNSSATPFKNSIQYLNASGYSTPENEHQTDQKNQVLLGPSSLSQQQQLVNIPVTEVTTPPEMQHFKDGGQILVGVNAFGNRNKSQQITFQRTQGTPIRLKPIEKGGTENYLQSNLAAAAHIKNQNLLFIKSIVSIASISILQNKSLSNQVVFNGQADLKTLIQGYRSEKQIKDRLDLNLMNKLTQLNGAVGQAIDFLSSYRSELGEVIGNAILAYNSLYLQQIEQFYNYKFQKDKKLQQMINQEQQQLDNLEKKKQELQNKIEICSKLVESKDQYIYKIEKLSSIFEKQVQFLQNALSKDEQERKVLLEQFEQSKTEAIKEFVDIDGKVERQKMAKLNEVLKLATEKVKRDDHHDSKLAHHHNNHHQSSGNHHNNHHGTPGQHHNNNNGTPSQHNNNNHRSPGHEKETDHHHEQKYDMSILFKKETNLELEQLLSHFEQKDLPQKQQTLAEIRKVLKQISINHGRNKGVQTEKAIWNHNLAYNYNEENENSSSSSDHQPKRLTFDQSEDSSTEEANYQEKMEKKFSFLQQQYNMYEQTNDEQVHKKNLLRLQNNPETKNIAGLADTQTVTQFQLNPNQFDIIEPPQVGYTKSLRALGLQNKIQLDFMQEGFNQICEIVIRNQKDPQQARFDRNNKTLRWVYSYSLLTFCCNEIKRLDVNPEEVSNFELLSWTKIKSLIFAIYELRVEFAHEINGLACSNYCTLNEFLIIYFMHALKGDRIMAEKRIIEFLINVRYYYNHQIRAKIFCQLLEITFFKTNFEQEFNQIQPLSPSVSDTDEYGDKKPKKQVYSPHGLYSDVEILENDVYVQEFFLHAFSVLNQGKQNFIESNEGNTYMKLRDEVMYSKHIISNIRGASGNVDAWNAKMKRYVSQIKVGENEEPFLDIDLVLSNMLEEYRNTKLNFKKALEKQFYKVFESFSTSCNVTYPIFNEMITDSNFGSFGADAPIDPLIEFPGEVSKMRAFIFALTSGQKNDITFNAENLVAGISRFGVQSPIPCVSARCQLYGNTQTIIDQLKHCEAKYGKLSIKVHMKRYSGQKPGKPQAFSRLSSQLSNHADQNIQYEEEKNADWLYEKNLPTNKNIYNVLETAKKIDQKKNKLEKDQQIENDQKLENLRIQLVEKNENGNLFKKKSKLKVKKELKDFQSSPPQQVGGIKMNLQNIKQFMDDYSNQLTQISSSTDLQKIVYQAKSKQIVVPSLGNVTNIFMNHLGILQQLQLNIKTLKQSYFQQMDRNRSWNQIDSILNLLNKGIKFLELPNQSLFEDKIYEQVQEEVKETKAISEQIDTIQPPQEKIEQENLDQYIDDFANSTNLDFNIFDFSSKMSRPHVLPTLTTQTITSMQLLSLVNPDKLQNFLKQIFLGYSTSIAYHNDLHGTDVMLMTSYFLNQCQMTQIIGLTKFDQLSMIIAAVCHDVGHDGFTNGFHVSMLTDRSVQSNDFAVQETFHAAQVFRILGESECNFADGFSWEQFVRFRKRVVGIILATDMAKHQDKVTYLDKIIKEYDIDQDQSNLSKFLNDDENKLFEKQQLFCEAVVHACDISNPARNFNVVHQWTYSLFEEFFNQGDIERDNGLPITMLCDRNTTVINEAQQGFINFVCLPMFTSLSHIMPNLLIAGGFIDQMKQNCQTWIDYEETEEDKNIYKQKNQLVQYPKGLNQLFDQNTKSVKKEEIQRKILMTPPTKHERKAQQKNEASQRLEQKNIDQQ